MEKLEKVYAVEFMTYTNAMKTSVSNKSEDIADRKYIEIGSEPLLIKESELDLYKEYGDGYRSIKFVGNLKLL